MLLEENLLKDLKHGGSTREKAFAELRSKLLCAMSHRLKTKYDVDDAFVEDAVQETLIVVLEKIDTFRGDSRFFTWVCSICIRVAMAEVRRKRWKDLSLDALTSDSVFDPVSPGADQFTEQVALAEELEAVKQAIDTALTDKQRTALLAELSGMGTSEIARRYKTTQGAIYKLTHDARRALVRHLTAAGYLGDSEK